MVLMNDGYALGSNVEDVPYATTPATSRLMATAAVSHEEFLRKNPKWSKASNGPDRGKWMEADDAERVQQTTRQLGKDGPHMEELPGGLADIPVGHVCFHLKRVCKIKSNEKYKVRWAVLGNLEKLMEECFAPTAAKKVQGRW
jgi:hypothetical protein